jgi:opacity protein-like surface antigen
VNASILGSGGGDLSSGSAGFSIAADYTTTPRMSLEADFTSLPSVTEGVILPTSANLWTLTANALYHLGTGRILPYGVAGLGFGHGSASVPPQVLALGAVDSSTNFVWDLGVGADLMLNNRLSLRGDLRHVFGSELVGSFNRVSAGIGLHFGSR